VAIDNNTTPSFFKPYQSIIDSALDQAITSHCVPSSKLLEAISYSTLLGGKRIRPILTLATADSFGAPVEQATIPACAVELVHAYSLIHDDLPAMDDDDLRRGHATCHKAFDEATAILAGDALQALAFELLTQDSGIDDKNKLLMIKTLSQASGARGMVHGQAIDFNSVGHALSLAELENMHRHKTGALIEASVKMGALASPAHVSSTEFEALSQYAQAIGLAFQVQDDILDITSDTATLGKKQGADIALNKPTYPSLLGLDGAKEKLKHLHQRSLDALNALPKRNTSALAEISNFIIHRHK
jgi:geranylgeranyl pyrophosphate synthase